MNERVMQFRIGMFVIFAGLVLTMMLIWFGETPSLFRDQVYVKVRYNEAPGVNEGIPVRKSGIRIGEVSAVEFDVSPDRPDGVLVTLALESKYKIKAGSVPRIGRALIGDVSIDFQPGTGPGLLKTGTSPGTAPVIEGVVAPDPSNALAAATRAFEKAGDTLRSINSASDGIAAATKKLEHVDQFIATWQETGTRVSSLAGNFDRVLKQSGADIGPAVASLRQVAEKLNTTLDAEALASLRNSIDRISTASAKLSTDLALAEPLFKDLGADARAFPKTATGQAMFRLNQITSDISLLTRNLNNGRGHLNPNGSIQQLVTKTELYDNLNRMSVYVGDVFGALKPVVNDVRTFASKVAKEPSLLTRGALRSQ